MRTFMAIVMLAASFICWAQEEYTAPRLLRADQLKVSIDQATLQRQYLALQGMPLEGVEYSPRGPITSVVGETGIVLPANTSGRKENDSATDILPLIGDLLLASGSESLTVRENVDFYGAERTLQLSQSIRGKPVIHSVVSLSYNNHTKRVSSITAHFVPDRDLPRAPKLSSAQAQEIVRQALETQEGSKAHFNESPYLGYFAEFGDPSSPMLVWALRAVTTTSDDIFYVDSISGLIVSRTPMQYELTRKVYDMNNSVLANFPQGLPDALNSTQINAQIYRSVPHNSVKDADDYLRLKIPDLIPRFPSTINTVVRYGLSASSSWTLAGGQDYIRLNGALSGSHTHGGLVEDTVVHEFAHGIVHREIANSGNPADRQWQALRESFADIAATVVDIAKYGSPDALTWNISDGFYADGDSIRSIRNVMFDPLTRNPGFDWYDDRQIGPYDWRHQNSGIVSHAYYLMVNGDRHARYTEPHIPDTVISALGEPTARNIFFNAFRNPSLDADPNFPKLKGAAMAHALAAHGSAARTQVKNAFEAVGICKTATVAPPAPTLQTIGDLLCAGRFNPIWDLITGATRYYAEVAPAQFGFAFATPVSDVDGETDSCFFRVTQPSLFRMMACNDCGCGPWSETEYLEYWSPCP